MTDATPHVPHLAWHLHHEKLLEVCFSCEERIAYIKSDKPLHEQEIRLRLFRPVVGPLPARLAKALAGWAKARAELAKACTGWVKARTKWDRAYTKWDRALAGFMPELEEMHRRECPNCPWDGRTIFPKQEVTRRE